MSDDVINPNDPEHVEAFHKVLTAYTDTHRSLERILKILSRQGFKTFEQAETLIKENTSE
jgi:predicted HAD superfamily Cof-like phosphohydrolase